MNSHVTTTVNQNAWFTAWLYGRGSTSKLWFFFRE